MDNRVQIEAVLTEDRARELRINPVRGNFDAAHLKEVHRRIFQDLPSLGFHDVIPGVYREAVKDGGDWIKPRGLEKNLARDRSVNTLALPHIHNVGTKRDLLFTLDQIAQCRDLPDLLRDAISPLVDRDKTNAQPVHDKEKPQTKGQER